MPKAIVFAPESRTLHFVRFKAGRVPANVENRGKVLNSIPWRWKSIGPAPWWVWLPFGHTFLLRGATYFLRDGDITPLEIVSGGGEHSLLTASPLADKELLAIIKAQSEISAMRGINVAPLILTIVIGALALFVGFALGKGL